MQEKVEMQKKAREEFELERKQVDAIVSRIQREDQNEMERKVEKQQETVAYIKQYLTDRDENLRQQQQSEVEENMTEASWLSCGSWGSSASKLEVDVDRVGPRLGDASGASASSLLLFSPLLDILSEIFISQPSPPSLPSLA